jgi:hypothetical protein
MFRRLIIFSLTLALISSCATTHPGKLATTVEASGDLNLKISSQLNKDFSDDSNQFFDLTFENLGGNWVHIDQVDVEFPQIEGAPHNIIVGDDLKAWAESYAIRKRKQDHNAELGIAGLILGGTALMVAAIAGSNGGNVNTGLLTTGAVAYGAGAITGVARDISKLQKEVNRGVTVPESHLLATSTIPSHGFLQRWILINVPKKLVAKTMRIRIHTLEGEEGTYLINL